MVQARPPSAGILCPSFFAGSQALGFCEPSRTQRLRMEEDGRCHTPSCSPSTLLGPTPLFATWSRGSLAPALEATKAPAPLSTPVPDTPPLAEAQSALFPYSLPWICISWLGVFVTFQGPLSEGFTLYFLRESGIILFPRGWRWGWGSRCGQGVHFEQWYEHGGARREWKMSSSSGLRASGNAEGSRCVFTARRCVPGLLSFR